jgi:hypothetical protein
MSIECLASFLGCTHPNPNPYDHQTTYHMLQIESTCLSGTDQPTRGSTSRETQSVPTYYAAEATLFHFFLCALGAGVEATDRIMLESERAQHEIQCACTT